MWTLTGLLIPTPQAPRMLRSGIFGRGNGRLSLSWPSEPRGQAARQGQASQASQASQERPVKPGKPGRLESQAASSCSQESGVKRKTDARASAVRSARERRAVNRAPIRNRVEAKRGDDRRIAACPSGMGQIHRSADRRTRPSASLLRNTRL